MTAIMVSGILTALGIWGVGLIMDTIMNENSAESFQFFDGLVGLIIITFFLAVAFVYQFILGMKEAYKYFHVYRIRKIMH